MDWIGIIIDLCLDPCVEATRQDHSNVAVCLNQIDKHIIYLCSKIYNLFLLSTIDTLLPLKLVVPLPSLG